MARNVSWRGVASLSVCTQDQSDECGRLFSVYYQCSHSHGVRPVYCGLFVAFTWFYLVLLGFTWFYLVLLGFTWFYLVLLGLTRHCSVLLGITQFYLTLLGFTWFYLVLLGFTWFSSAIDHVLRVDNAMAEQKNPVVS